jgi:hypothetical protein
MPTNRSKSGGIRPALLKTLHRGDYATDFLHVAANPTPALHGHYNKPKNKKDSQAEACKSLILLLYSGADCRFRTGHLMITNQLLYQMS